jgi:hypothetical protein
MNVGIEHLSDSLLSMLSKYTSGSGVAGSYGNSVYKFLGK